MKRDIQKLKRWCIRKKLQGWNVALICSHARIPRRTFYNWFNAYQKEGWSGLDPKSRRPNTIHRTPGSIVERIIELRKCYHWGPNKIAGYLNNKGINISHDTAYRVICKEGLNNPIDKPRKTWGKRRFHRKKPNELWQCDWKLTNEDRWMVSFLDDYSRFVTGSVVVNYPTTSETIRLLTSILKNYPTPEQILTDRGTQFYAVRGGESRFHMYCRNCGIEHIVASKRRPTTIGKIEAFHKAYEYEYSMFNNHHRFIRYWNYERPHQGIGYLCPAELYFRKSVPDVMG